MTRCGCAACAGGFDHASDCAVHNAPALPAGLCNCASGLPAGSTNPERQARLERSREWLKNYHKERT
jgi:hypothetical protein